MKRHIMKSLSCLMSVNLLVFTGGMSVLPSAFAEDSIKQAEWNGHRYAVIEKELKPLEAEEYCKSLGGHLAAVTSQKEQDFIAGLASEVDYESFWIGASDDGSEGEWYWLNGEKWDYTAWYPGGAVGTYEPNNGLGAGDDYCCMNRARDYLWVDAFGGYDGYTTTCYFICEWEGTGLNDVSNQSSSVGSFISDIKVVGIDASDDASATAKTTLEQEGYSVIDYDLNLNCRSGSDYIYLGYKTTNDFSKAIKNIIIVDKWSPDDDYIIEQDGASYHLCPYEGTGHFTSLHGDLNSNASGNDGHCFYTKDEFNGVAVSGIFFDSNPVGAVCDFDLNGDASTGEKTTSTPDRPDHEIYMHLIYSAGGNIASANNHSYKLFDYLYGMTWDEAKEYCESLGGHLATVTSEDEEKLIESLIADGTKDAYWLGGRDKNLELTWITGEEVTYTKWGANQPDNYEEDGGDCVSVFRTSDFGVGANDWADISNKAEPFEKSQLGFICEWDSNTKLVDIRSAFERIESEDYDDATDRVHSADNYGTGTCIGWIADKHYIRYNNIDFGNGANSAIINAAENYHDSKLEIHIDALDGKCIGVWSIPNTESWFDFYEYTCPVSLVTGVHDVFLICNAEPSDVDVINLDYFTFSKESAAENGTDFEEVNQNTTTTTTTSAITSTTTTTTASGILLGDVDDNGIVDGRDASNVLTYYAKSSTGKLETEYTDKQKKAADYNMDGIIDGRDATAILTYYAKSSTGKV